MHTDDVSRGRLLSRREIFSLLGAAGAALLVGCTGDDESGSPNAGAMSTPVATSGSTSAAAVAATTTVPSCVVVPELTEGPYFVVSSSTAPISASTRRA